MRRKFMRGCILLAAMAMAMTGCAGGPSPKGTPADPFAGRSVEQREKAYTGKGAPPLVAAIWARDAAAVASLLAKGANVNEGKDEPPLLDAIDCRPEDFSLDVVRALLAAKGVDVNKYGSRAMGAYTWVRTPLIAAAGRGNAELVKLLLDKGAKPDLADWYVPDQTLFGKGPLNTALIYAAENGHPAVVSLLLDHGARIDYQNASGLTALISASSMGHAQPERKANIVQAISILLERKAKVNTLAIPVNAKYLKIDLPPGTPAAVNAMLLQNGNGVAALHGAANTGFIEAAKLLLDKGASIELSSYGNKWTALFFAVQTQQNAMIDFLLDRGANINATDTVGTTPLLTAVAGLYYDTAALLLNRGAKVNAATTMNALMTAANVGRTDKEGESIRMMNLLIDKGIDVNYQAPEGSTALMMACGRGVIPKSPTRAKLLLDRGAKPDLRNKKGETALMFAAYRGYLEIARLLLDKGVDVNAKNAEGRTALMIASAAVVDLTNDNGDFPKLVKLLLDRGAEVGAMDKKKNNALSLATLYEHKETVALLVAKGAKLDGTADPFAEAYKTIVGTWEGPKNSNPYATYRFAFKADKTWTYEAEASAAFKKEYPTQFAGMNEQLKGQAAMEGSKGTFSFREQFLVLKTNSLLSSTRVYQWSMEGGKLKLNGGEFVLTRSRK